ncbi:hypothetical protein Mp_7g00550 [Marchantia polymorpha subsp. ruderalis]|uniref:Uncharacterized protein n=2 Tax=Marchantia polymorpha TaxID=3197 RepID=A0AAF6BUS5_MARPO|nr:hypothetical protein MARPO_0046s0070 [Marchantia polymorpha]BBN15759.1 hypothetical protein Mp_7g00550 [Marchantia polymorpha subsp. ruderalis]|eukprot:PTQ39249.1 hypothetical protein MARPO_0046s0070 [Marchantia polymorpha]
MIVGSPFEEESQSRSQFASLRVVWRKDLEASGRRTATVRRDLTKWITWARASKERKKECARTEGTEERTGVRRSARQQTLTDPTGADPSQRTGGDGESTGRGPEPSMEGSMGGPMGRWVDRWDEDGQRAGITNLVGRVRGWLWLRSSRAVCWPALSSAAAAAAPARRAYERSSSEYSSRFGRREAQRRRGGTCHSAHRGRRARAAAAAAAAQLGGGAREDEVEEEGEGEFEREEAWRGEFSAIWSRFVLLGEWNFGRDFDQREAERFAV